MASQGPNASGTGTNVANWANPTNIQSSDNVYATCFRLAGASSGGIIQATNFGFTIPAGATINGVVFDVERLQSAGTGVIEDASVLLIKGGSTTGSQHAIAGAWPGSDTFQTYGTSNDLWGTTLTASDVNASNFGVQIQIRETSFSDSATGAIDFVRATVYYTVPTRSFSPGLLGV